MKRKIDLFGIYLPFYIVTTVSAVVMRAVSLFLHFDLETGYFTEKTLIGISNGIIIASVIILFSYLFTSSRGLKLIPNFTSPATYVPTGLAIIATLFMVFSLLGRVSKTPSYDRLQWLILVLTAIFAILSVIHFALTALVENHSNTKRANFGICTVLFLSLYSMFIYFSKDLPINAPNKALDQMAYLFSAVFFLYETRLSFGRERWRHYITFGFIASAITAYTAIPSCILYFANGTVISNSVYEIALTLALFAFITSRLFLTGNLIEDKESRSALILLSASDSRDREINPIPEKPEIIDIEGESLEPASEDSDGNQLTIDDIEDIDGALADEADENSAEDTETAETDEIAEEENDSPTEN